MAEKIILVGGGLAGSLLSVFFAKRGFDVHVYERRSDPRDTNVYQGRSINLALSTRGINALKKVGIDAEVLATGLPMSKRMIHTAAGELIAQPYGKEGQAIYSVSRGGLNIKLLELADKFNNIHLHFNMRCIDVNPDESEVIFENGGGESVSVHGSRIIGTDGAFAATRLRMQMMERFDYSQQYETHGYKELSIPAGAGGKFLMDKNSLHIWPRGDYMMIALPNPGGDFTCTLFFPFEGANSFEALRTEEKVQQFFNEHFADASPIMPTLIHDFFKNPTGNLVTIKCFPWVYKDKLALLGDAAHAIVPFYGQGMNCAFEDCVVLDYCVGEYGSDWKKVFEIYQDLRKPNADAIASLALQNFLEMRDRVGDKAFLHKKHVEHELSELYPDKFISQYELVTFSNEPYVFAQQKGQENDRLLEKIISDGADNDLHDPAKIEKYFKK